MMEMEIISDSLQKRQMALKALLHSASVRNSGLIHKNEAFDTGLYKIMLIYIERK
jgi:hypothetical protein